MNLFNLNKEKRKKKQKPSNGGRGTSVSSLSALPLSDDRGRQPPAALPQSFASSSLPLRAFHRGDRQQAEDVYMRGALPSAFAESHENLGAPVAAGSGGGSQEARGALAADKGEGSSNPGVVDPFSAAQVLSADTYKKHLLAQVHIHSKSLGLSDESPLSADTKKTSRKASLREGKLQEGLQYSTGGESLLELAKEEREERADVKDEDEAQLLLPATYASRNVAPHWPMFAEDASDPNDEEEENPKEQQQQQQHAVSLPAKERQAASLVEAASSAEEEGGESQAEKQSKASSEAEEQEGESEGAETEEKLGSSKSEKQESASEEGGSAEETSKEEKRESEAGAEGSETEERETETHKHVSSKKKHESESEDEGESGGSDEAAGDKHDHEADKGDTEGSSHEEAPKQSSEAKDVETSAAEESSSVREEESSKEDEASKQEGASKKEAHAAESAAEVSEKEKPETTSAAHGGKKKEHEEHEETHSASESKGSSSKEEHLSEAESTTTLAGSAAAPNILALPEAKEKKETVKQEQQKQEKAAETPHEKTEEEKAEEHRMHMKQLAERATKLANIQRMEQDALLKLHMLGEGGPRENAPPPSGTSSMSVQDQQQHRQLEEATKAAQSLTSHLRVQHELKKKEMALKQKEIAHLNLLKHLQVVMQSAVSTVWTKLTGVQATLKRLVQQSTYVNKRFLRETDNRVLRPQELPKAVMSEEERKREGALAKKQGVSPLDCPVECAPKTCDNKPSFPTHCFRYDLVAGGGGFRTCAPFTDEATAACPEVSLPLLILKLQLNKKQQSYTRCAMAAPVRGRQYELLASHPNDPLPQALFIRGNNMHSCLRLMIVHKETECTPSDAQSVQAAIKDSQAASGMPPPRVASPGEYKLCMLQFWMPPDKLKGDVIVLGVDEIGSVRVQEIEAARRPANAAQAETAAAAAERETAALDVMQPLPLHKPGELEEKETETAASKEEKLSVDNEVPSKIQLHPSPPKA
ncbi:hypothetical protein Emed_003974 [Eimeria media]